MPFSSWQEAERRLVADPSKLTQQEVRDLTPWMRQISDAGVRRLNAELALQNLESIQKFERSSSLTRWLIWLTGVVVVLTVIIAYYTFLLARIAHQVK